MSHHRSLPAPAGLPPDLRRSLFDLLRAELAVACAEALARGVGPDELARDLHARTGRLRSARVEVAQDAQDDLDDAVEPPGVG